MQTILKSTLELYLHLSGSRLIFIWMHFLRKLAHTNFTNNKFVVIKQTFGIKFYILELIITFLNVSYNTLYTINLF
jgi:hypothetical protein